MNNSDRNTRTLIVCFVMAMVALVPLRFMEYGNYQPQVLGDNVDVVVLPNAEIGEEVSDCINADEADIKVNELINRYVSSQIDKTEADSILLEIEDIEINKCQ